MAVWTTKDGVRPDAGNAKRDTDRAMDAQRLYVRALQMRQEETARLVSRAAATTARLARLHLLAPVELWYRRERLRQELAMLDDRRLAAIGIRREEIGTVVKNAYAGPAAA